VSDRYLEHPPTFDPHGIYAAVWMRETGAPQEVRVVPDACVDVIWHRESGRLFVAGPDSLPQVGPIGPGTLVGVRFSPGSAPAALGVPSDALRNGRVPLDAIWSSAEVRRLGGALAGAADARQVLQHAVAAHTDRARDGVATAVLRLLTADKQVGPIAEVVGLSERQLHRRCLTAFGYGPKILHRVLRFDRARRLARGGLPFAEIAHRLGYADQAHLSRDVKALAGVTLGELVRSGRAPTESSPPR
jgi:AraC-like DNA-binding protein